MVKWREEIMKISGNKLFLRAMKEENVDTIFAYPGGFIVDLLDELHKQDAIRVVLPRHEQGLIHAAEGYARSTGKVGVCLVTSGPGATNLVTGIADAYYDSIPLVCFTGQVPRKLIGNDAFQEVDIVGITRSITKHSVMVTKREDLGRIIKEAFYIASTGKPGPVLIDIPADMMKEVQEEYYPKKISMRSYRPNESVHIGQCKKAVAELKNAKKPIFLVGGGVKISNAEEVMTKLAEKTGIPVITTIMGRGAIPTDHKLFVGNSGMHGSYACNKAITECDVLFSIGARFSDRTTGDIDNFAPNAKIVHVDIDTASISRTVKVDIPIVADAKRAIEKLLTMVEDCSQPEWLAQLEEWKKEYPIAKPASGEFDSQAILNVLDETYEDMIVVTDVGQHQMWTTQYLDITRARQLITSGGLGTMGFGFPASIGAQIANPDKRVVCISGDGGFQMNLQELATAVSEGLPIKIIIVNNGHLGMVRQMQSLFFEKSYALTSLNYRTNSVNDMEEPQAYPYLPDFVQLAASYQTIGYRVTDQKQFKEALLAADKVTDRPVIIECIIGEDGLVLPMVKSGTPLSDMILED